MKEHWFDVGSVKRIEPMIDKRHKSGFGKDAEFDEIKIGTKVILENGGTFVFPLKTTPDCQVGDRILVQFERRIMK